MGIKWYNMIMDLILGRFLLQAKLNMTEMEFFDLGMRTTIMISSWRK